MEKIKEMKMNKCLSNLPRDICIVLSNFIEDTPKSWDTFRKVFRNARLACELKIPIWLEFHLHSKEGMKFLGLSCPIDTLPPSFSHICYFEPYKNERKKETDIIRLKTTLFELNSILKRYYQE